MKIDLTTNQTDELINLLKERFEKNMNRHKNLSWDNIKPRLTDNKLISLFEMENTGGEPDVIGYDNQTNEYLYVDCSPQTPNGRLNTCYDQEALESRKKFPPENSAMEMAKKMGIELLTEEQYFDLQKLGEFDTKTSSWILTPPEVRKLKGALFCDRRYNKVFTYHNGADSYYSVRGFRGILKV